jgi:glutamate--cysteine ligase
MSHVLSDSHTASPIRTVAEAGAYIARVCFKHGPPRRNGIELEWLLHDPADPSRRPEPAELIGALGAHSPRTLDPASPALALPGGGLVTVEPGGQVEISSAPASSTAALITAMRRDIAALTALLEPTGFQLSARAIDTRSPHRVLSTPRYDAMAEGFDRVGPAGRTMMCSTAAAQICIDLGTVSDAPRRWLAAHVLGPVLLAAFANSPVPGAVSGRMAAWWALDPERTLPPPTPVADRLALDPLTYVQRALDTTVLARQTDSGGWLTSDRRALRDWIETGEQLSTADLDLHLSMLFPPVRPQGYLELRYLDAQPAEEWLALLAFITGLFDCAVDQVIEICAPAAGRWQQATERGLADPPLRAAALQLSALAPANLGRLDLHRTDLDQALAVLDRRLAAGISPADDARAVGQPNCGRDIT